MKPGTGIRGILTLLLIGLLGVRLLIRGSSGGREIAPPEIRCEVGAVEAPGAEERGEELLEDLRAHGGLVHFLHSEQLASETILEGEMEITGGRIMDFFSYYEEHLTLDELVKFRMKRDKKVDTWMVSFQARLR